ncbi:Hypothetical protein PHPALM_8806 [Phytophthora palmivora]|uniref:Tc1-like transposase DDE domain-containing protein n=1 Tax=Phytophthora palmivora TaxID=4796 RepID=A0A2P4Y8Y3_9STRA|nr:Hypothetical protein PHPALM_8806 [Phytophthora palmivora]
MGFKRWTAEYLSCEGLETWCVNVTPAIKEVLEGNLNVCCSYTLRTLSEFIRMDFNVNRSTSTISRHLLDMLYTVKQVNRRRTRIEPTTCNNKCGEVGEHFYRPRYSVPEKRGGPLRRTDISGSTGPGSSTRLNPHWRRPGWTAAGVPREFQGTSSHETNKERRKQLAEALVEHHRLGNLVIYFDEINYNLLAKRSHGRPKKGKRAIEKLPPTKGTNLQIQCAVSSVFGVVAYRTRRGSIKMQDNDDFVDELYAAVKYQAETLVTTRDDLVLLRLGPYSPMCNPIENCFSVLKSHIKEYLALMRPEMTQAPTARTATGSLISMTEARMRLLERAAHVSMPKIAQELVVTMELHARDFVSAAIRYGNMSYGA